MLTPQPEPLLTSRAPEQQRPAPATTSSDDPLVYLSGRVPKSLRDRLKLQAVRDSRPLAELLADAVRGYLDRR